MGNHISFAEMPKVLWTLWFQGWDSAPPLVKACISGWRRMNPDWTVNCLDRNNLGEFLHGSDEVQALLDRSDISLASLSDIVRIDLLCRHGGVWIDSTTYCLRPLRSWLPSAMPRGFFAFDRPVPDRMVSSWFLASEPENPLVLRWRNAVLDYWHDREENDEYFWFHHLFTDIYKKYPEARTIWNNTPKLSANGPHYFIPYRKKFLKQPSAQDRFIVNSAISPLLKLTHKEGAAETNPIPEWLIERENRLSANAVKANPEKPQAKCGKILVCWFGSTKGHGTIGDLLAAQSVTRRLYLRGYDFVHCSLTEDVGVKGANVDFEAIDPDSVDVLIFTCGPVLKGHPIVEKLIARFEKSIKIGLGVSIFPTDSPFHAQPFDKVFAREGADTLYEDIAAASPFFRLPRQKDGKADRPRKIGLCLRGAQVEYGADRAQSDEVEKLIEDSLERVSLKGEVAISRIENHLVQSGTDPRTLLDQYSEFDLIITSRFHGGVLSLMSGTPFIAIDQIRGGAKVKKLLSATGWPFVYGIDEIDVDTVSEAAEKCLYDRDALPIESTRSKVRNGAYRTLKSLEDFLLSHGQRGR